MIAGSIAAAVATQAGLSASNAEITWQATIVSYMDDFKFLLIVCVPAAAMLVLLDACRRARRIQLPPTLVHGDSSRPLLVSAEGRLKRPAARPDSVW
jgi:hypothetical protein